MFRLPQPLAFPGPLAILGAFQSHNDAAFSLPLLHEEGLPKEYDFHHRFTVHTTS